MTETYQPTARRPIAAMFRTTANLAVRLCIRLHISADAVSYSSIVASLLAGASFFSASRHSWLLLIGPLFCFVRLWLNMLDGMVALAAGSASRRGEILNDLPDRFSDAIIFAGVAESGLCNASLGYGCAIAALLTAYVGTIAQAVGARRQYGGVMSKPWRMVVLAIGAWIAWLMIHRAEFFAARTSLNVACILIQIGCVQTIAVRLRRTLREINP